MGGYGFAEFIRDVDWRVRRLVRSVEDPDFVWPGVLILDAADGLSAESFAFGTTQPERDELSEELAASINRSLARRFAWVMPCLREDRGRHIECLLIVYGERGRMHAAYADLRRRPGEAPRLGPFNHGPFGGGARRLSWRFVEPLVAALER